MTTDRPARKLDWKYLGPYKVLERIGKRAYRIKIPATWKVHDVFHVSLLEPKKPDNFGRQAEPQPAIVIDEEEEYEVEEILNSRIYRNKVQYLIKWKGYSMEENTWQSLADVQHAKEAIEHFHTQNPAAVRFAPDKTAPAPKKPKAPTRQQPKRGIRS